MSLPYLLITLAAVTIVAGMLLILNHKRLNALPDRSKIDAYKDEYRFKTHDELQDIVAGEQYSEEAQLAAEELLDEESL